jgi:fructose-specific phosphotransferase system IIA component
MGVLLQFQGIPYAAIIRYGKGVKKGIEGLTSERDGYTIAAFKFTCAGIMNLRKLLVRDVISLDLQGNTKDEIIQEMLDLLEQAGKLNNRKAAEKAILDREKKMSTGMQNGIAIPHGKTDTVDSLIVAIGVKKDGVDFESLDGQPSVFFIMTLSPANRTGPHIQFLAEISRQLNDPHVRERILAAGNKDDVITILAGSGA